MTIIHLIRDTVPRKIFLGICAPLCLNKDLINISPRIFNRQITVKKFTVESKFNYVNRKDFDRILKEIPSLKIRKWLDSDVIMLFKILYWCALRPNEGIRLQKSDFRFESLEIFLGETKTNPIDYAPIPTPFLQELQTYINSKSDGPLFPGLKYITFYFWLKRLGKLCNIEALQIPQRRTREKTVGHIFRKSVGKDMLFGVHGQSVRDISIISKQLRHKKLSTTMDHYLNANLEAVKEAWGRPI